MSSATTISLFLGKRPGDADAARMAANDLRARGFAVTERHVEGGNYVVETNAPRTMALEVKRRARARRRAMPAPGDRESLPAARRVRPADP